jgi:hypothetical protein
MLALLTNYSNRSINYFARGGNNYFRKRINRSIPEESSTTTSLRLIRLPSNIIESFETKFLGLSNIIESAFRCMNNLRPNFLDCLSWRILQLLLARRYWNNTLKPHEKNSDRWPAISSKSTQETGPAGNARFIYTISTLARAPLSLSLRAGRLRLLPAPDRIPSPQTSSSIRIRSRSIGFRSSSSLRGRKRSSGGRKLFVAWGNPKGRGSLARPYLLGRKICLFGGGAAPLTADDSGWITAMPPSMSLLTRVTVQSMRIIRPRTISWWVIPSVLVIQAAACSFHGKICC